MNVPNGFGLDTKDEPENAVKDEDVEYNPGARAKNQASKRLQGQKSERVNNNPTLRLKPENFDWFLQGIDQKRLEGILENMPASADILGNTTF